jgi:ferrochelatase
MAQGCAYEEQLSMVSNLVAQACHIDSSRIKVVYQSRSGPPSVPWLEPDICDYVKELHVQGVKFLIIDPIGFVSDHMEVIYDLDTQAAELCQELGIKMKRVPCAGSQPSFIEMIRDLIIERMEGGNPQTVGALPAGQDNCSSECCPSGVSARRAL